MLWQQMRKKLGFLLPIFEILPIKLEQIEPSDSTSGFADSSSAPWMDEHTYIDGELMTLQ